MSKGVPALVDGGWGEDEAYRYGTLLLFGGMVLTGILDLLVHFVTKLAGANESIDATKVPEVRGHNSSESGHKDPVADMEAGKRATGDQDSSTSVTAGEIDHVCFLIVP